MDHSIGHLLDKIVRLERGRLIAGLVSRLGPRQLELAEDMAQEALVRALSSWTHTGLPEKPAAWLRKVAWNAAIDQLRKSSRLTTFDEQDPEALGTGNIITPTLGDPELDLMVLCCDPVLSETDQLALTLTTVSGFTARETAALFLITENTMAQRLARAKRKLRANADAIGSPPTRFELASRLPTMLKTIYLIFAAGYTPRNGTVLVRQDVSLEALRLSAAILANKETISADAHALHALLLFQISRFPSRYRPDGSLALLKFQDRDLWNVEQIRTGIKHLAYARRAKYLSRYHVEAGIAAVHAQAQTWEATDWQAISSLYDILKHIAPSPIVDLNAGIAIILTGDLERARTELDKLSKFPRFKAYAPYHLALAEIAKCADDQSAAKQHLKTALACQNSAPVKEHIVSEIETLI